jgi:PKD repeat protein
MIKKIYFSVFLLACFFWLSSAIHAQVVITQWTFEGDVITPSTGSGTASLLGGTTATFATGNGGGRGWNTTTYPVQSTNSGTAGTQFLASTSGYSNIIVSWDHRASGTASRWSQLQYTTNGTTWNVLDDNDGGLSPHDTFYPFSFDLSSIPAANDNPNFGVRIVSIFSPLAFNQNATLSYGANEAYMRANTDAKYPPEDGVGTGNYAVAGTWRFDNVTISGTEITGATPVKLVVTSVNGGNPPSVNTPFEVVVQAQDADNLPAAVTQNTQVTLTKATGTGTLSGTLVGTINTGQHTITFNNVLYNVAQSGVSITASATSGMTLTPGTSAPFTVLAVATQLVFDQFPAYGQINAPIATFEVHALRPDFTIDENFTGSITLSKASGPGTVGGTLVKNAVAGVAVFNDITFDTQGSYALNANSGSLPQASSTIITVLGEATLAEVILPQYIMANEPASHRIPYAFRVTISGLIPNATYKYINQVVLSDDSPTTNGAGNMIIATTTGDFIRTTNPDFAVEGTHGLFTTNGSGSYTGWFVTEPTGNAKFTAGNEVYMRIRLNNGAGGNTVQNRVTTTSPIDVIALGEDNVSTLGTGVVGKAFGNPKDFAFMYDNTAGSGRPLSGTFIENDGTSGGTNYAPFYQTHVDALDRSFGSLVPNQLPSGIRRVEVRDRASGSVNTSETISSADGLWPYGMNTVNPLGGATAMLLTAQPDFSASATQIVPGGSVTFTADTPYAPDTYFWEFLGGDPGTSTSANPTVAYYNEGEWDVILTLTNAFGEETIVKAGYILVSDAPIANFSGEPLIINPGGEVQFTDLSQGVIETWTWTFEGGTPATFNGQNPPAIVYSEPGTYDVTLTVSNSEGSDTKDMTDYIHVGLAPEADFDATFEIVDFSAVYTFSDLSENNPATWAWTFENGNPASSAAQNPVITYFENGEFDVSLTVTNIFGEDTEIKVGFVNITLIGLGETNFTHVLTVAPNPAGASFTLTAASGTTIRILNSHGSLIYSTVMDNQQLTVNTQSFAPGMYVIEGQLKDSSKVVRTKLVVR